MNIDFPFRYPGGYTALSLWLSLSVWLLYLPKRAAGIKKAAMLAAALVLLLAVWGLPGGSSAALFAVRAILSAAVISLALYALYTRKLCGIVLYGCHIALIARLAASVGWHIYYTGYLAVAYHLDYQGLPPVPPDTLALMEYASMGFAFVVLFGALLAILHLRKPLEPATWSSAAVCAVILIVTYIIGNMFSWYSQSFFAHAVRGAAIIIRSLCDIIGAVMLFGFDDLVGRIELNRELSETNRLLERQYEQYQQYKANDEAMRRLYHDMKHQIAFARGEQDEKKREGYLAELDQIVSRHELSVSTGSSVLDTLLSGKNQVCMDKGITMTVFADAAEIGFMDTMDICSIFGNALDNAIECEETIEEREKRLIKIEIARKKELFVIRIENYCENPPEFLDGYPVTTKKEPRFHGYGVKSIKAAAEKYGGHATICYERKWFSLVILIPIPQG